MLCACGKLRKFRWSICLHYCSKLFMNSGRGEGRRERRGWERMERREERGEK